MKMNKSHLAMGCGRVAAAVIAAGLAASLGVLAPSVAVADEAAATTLEATTQQDPATQAADEPEADADVVAAAPVAPAAEDAADDQPAAGAETPATKSVAMIGKTGYATLDDALAAAEDGDVIDLVDDAETEKGFGIYGIALTVNGNGHVITANKRGVYVLKGGKPASLTFNDVKLNMAPVEGTAVAAGNEANWAAVILNYGCELVFNNSTVTLSPAGNLNTAVYFHSGRLTLNKSKMSVKGFSINGFCTDGRSTTPYTSEINVLDDSELEVSGNGAGITSAIQVTVDGSRLMNSNNRGNGSNGADYIVRNGSVADVSGNGSHGMSARNVTIAGSSTVTCNDNGYAGVHFTGSLDVDGTSSLKVDRNAKKGIGGGLRAMSPSARGHVAEGAAVEVCDNKCNGLENKGTFTFDEGSKLTIMGNHETGNGGGVFNYDSGRLTLPSDAVIYNNHADKSGDDICSKGYLKFGGTSADWILDDCSHAIDGWYDDAATSRWSAHGETKHVALTRPGEIEGTIALKAAHGLVSVNYEFVGDAPEGAKAPETDTGLELGAYTAKAQQPVDGYAFDGWYTDEACTTKWNDGDALTGSMTLYGKWTKNPAAPTTPDAGNKTPDKKLPQTGDTTSAALPALLAGGSLAALGAGIALRRREH